MNFHSSSQAYLRSTSQVGARPQSLHQRLAKLPINLSFWKPVGKTLLFVLPAVLAVNMYVSSAVGRIDESIIVIDNYRHELMDRNIELRAMKAKLRNPKQLQALVAEKLSLYVHTPGQVGKYNRRKGYFIYL